MKGSVAYLDKRNLCYSSLGLRASDLLLDRGEQSRVCLCHRILGNIRCVKGEIGEAIDHIETALGIAPSFNWHHQLYWIHYCLAQFFKSKTGSTTLTLTLDVQSHTRSTSRTLLVARCSCRPSSGTNSAGSKRQSPRHCALLIFLRRLGPRRMRRAAEISSVVSKCMKNFVPSSHESYDGELLRRCYFLHLLILHPQLGAPDSTSHVHSGVSPCDLAPHPDRYPVLDRRTPHSYYSPLPHSSLNGTLSYRTLSYPLSIVNLFCFVVFRRPSVFLGCLTRRCDR